MQLIPTICKHLKSANHRDSLLFDITMEETKFTRFVDQACRALAIKTFGLTPAQGTCTTATVTLISEMKQE